VSISFGRSYKVARCGKSILMARWPVSITSDHDCHRERAVDAYRQIGTSGKYRRRSGLESIGRLYTEELMQCVKASGMRCATTAVSSMSRRIIVVVTLNILKISVFLRALYDYDDPPRRGVVVKIVPRRAARGLSASPLFAMRGRPATMNTWPNCGSPEKSWIGVEEWQHRVPAARCRPKVRRSSVVFSHPAELQPERTMIPVGNRPSQLWSMFDGYTAEIEVLDFFTH
jgi:hypothetical protein